MFTIETDIPMPSGQRSRLKGPFAETALALNVGQSFFAAARSAKGSYAALSPSKMNGQKYRIAAAEKDGVKGIRVWRIEATAAVAAPEAAAA